MYEGLEDTQAAKEVLDRATTDLSQSLPCFSANPDSKSFKPIANSDIKRLIIVGANFG
jgi:hypothetical protein